MESEKKIQALKHWIPQLINYFGQIGFNVQPLPKIVLNKRANKDDDLFIQTGYYSPDEEKLVLFINGRHIKDILRTFCHEMVHRNQHLRDPEFGTRTSDKKLADDPLLKEIESEAFLMGNLLFRGFTEEFTHQ